MKPLEIDKWLFKFFISLIYYHSEVFVMGLAYFTFYPFSVRVKLWPNLLIVLYVNKLRGGVFSAYVI